MVGLIIVLFCIIVLISGAILYIIFYSLHKKNEKNKFASNNKNNFNKAKNKYEELKEKKTFKYSEVKEIKSDKNRFPGIYGIFYDNQKVNEVIPIYIGQSKDLRARWKSHINEIEKVKEGKSDSRKYSKILHYAQTKKLSEKDLKFVVLKKTDVEKLNEQEKKYIKIFQADVYGFNATKGNK